MLRRLRALAFFCSAALLASCGGGGGGSAAPGAPAVPASGPRATASVTFSIAIPGRTPHKLGRLPAYISSETSQATIVYTPSGGGPSGTINTGCTTACNAVFQAPVGVDAFVITLQDPSGKALSRGATTAVVTASQPNTINVTFDGIVHDATLRIAPSTLPAGTPATAFMFVDAHDADGATIVTDGTYVDANGGQVLFTIFDPGRSTSISINSSGVSAPGTILPVTYTGAASLGTSFTLSTTATLPGAVTGGTLAVVPSTVYTYPYVIAESFGHNIVSDGAQHFFAYADDFGVHLLSHSRWSRSGVRRANPSATRRTQSPRPGNGFLFTCCDHNATNAIVQSPSIADLAYDPPSGNLYTDFGAGLVGYPQLAPGPPINGSFADSNEGVDDLTSATDGRVYYTATQFDTGQDVVGYADTGLTTFTEVPTPTMAAGVGRITFGHDGNAWFVESVAGKIGRLTPAAGLTPASLTEFSLPHATDVPVEITDSPVQNAVIVLGFSNGDPTQGTVWKMGYHASAAIVFPVTLPAQACGCGFYRLHATPDLGLWTIDIENGDLVRIDMPSKAVAEFPVLTTTNPFAEDFAFAADGSIMYVGTNTNGVGKLVW